MTGFTFKARCPVCGRHVKVRGDGTLAVHPRGGDACAGSGEKP